jgi:hypothetical protein
MHGTQQLYNVATGVQENQGATVAESVIPSFEDGDGYFGALLNGDTKGLLYNPGFQNETDNIIKWNVEIGPQAAQSPFGIAYGTSASNPLIVKGGVATFIVKVFAPNDINQGRLQLRNAICAALNGDSIDSTAFDLIDSQSVLSPTYSFDLGLSNGNSIANVASNPNSYLVNAVSDRSFLESNNNTNLAPCGYFIVNQASVTLRCRSFLSVDGYSNDNATGFLALEVDSIDNAETKTCIPDADIDANVIGVLGDLPDITKWVVLDSTEISGLTQDFIESNFDNDWQLSLYQGNQISPSSSVGDPSEATKVNDQIERVFGYLQFEQGATIYQSVRQRAENSGTTDSTSLYVTRGLSLVDGDSGPRGVQFPSFRSGRTELITDSVLPFFQPGLAQLAGVNPFEFSLSEGDESPVEAISSASFLNGPDSSESTGGSRSFKSSANHDFGVVYYDQRGRASNVNPVGSVYVAGYSPAERGSGLQGRVSINVQLQEEAPDWAFHYQIVYGGNSTVNRFVQYTTGGAFIPIDSGEEQNIFVSLNYLQNNDDVSYVDAFGARSPEGSNRIYEFREGDKLRVISYYNEADQRVFPTNYVFDVVGLRDLGEEPDGNPLSEDDQTVPDVKQGDFLVLRNNPTASGFRYADVAGAGGASETFLHNWNSRCVVEIFSPSLSQEAEERVFYEVSEVYPTDINNQGVVVHSETDITLTRGDVWWRRMAVNMPEPPGPGDAGYTNLIGGADGDGFVAPSFRSYHLESETFSDLVRNADVYSYGKVKAILPNSKEVRRRSSITFGEGNNYASKLVRFTSFNPSLFPFKDLPNNYGAVNFLEAFNEFLLVIQEDKLSRLPVSRQILSDVAGNQQLIASDLILGTQAFYAGDFGCDNNPESVVVVDNDVYFANKSVAEVYRFNRNEGGVRVISDNGMEEFFERLFRNAGVGARIVGGYDPLHSEFLISIYQPNEIPDAPNVQFVTQAEDTGGGTTPNEEVLYASDFSESTDEFVDQLGDLYQFDFGQAIGGVGDSLLVTDLLALELPFTRPTTLVIPENQSVTLSLNVYFPESNVTLSGLQVSTNTSLTISNGGLERGVWNTLSITSGSLVTGASSFISITPIGSTPGDVMYIKDVQLSYVS